MGGQKSFKILSLLGSSKECCFCIFMIYFGLFECHVFLTVLDDAGYGVVVQIEIQVKLIATQFDLLCLLTLIIGDCE